jgi:hypothetical protein
MLSRQVCIESAFQIQDGSDVFVAFKTGADSSLSNNADTTKSRRTYTDECGS